MVDAVLRARRRKVHERMLVAATQYADRGWPVCAGAYPPDRQPQPGASGRACSCDRIGCPAPGAHPVSPNWQRQATADKALIGRWWTALPEASIILVTGRSFDVLDVPVPAGRAALTRMERSGIRPGPVAVSAQDRALFLVTTRAALADEDEWWSCHLDCEPEMIPEIAGLRWHCKDSYVLAPPSRLSSGLTARWIRGPAAEPLPDALRLLEYLADACEETAP
ncbi:MAG TPA: bifunctional DNA primase/polymerase [Streptosporangiaceae bacterium]|nr:bifunctional DNA primase/polymerase [Streptosporangiaceae bacterium]